MYSLTRRIWVTGSMVRSGTRSFGSKIDGLPDSKFKTKQPKYLGVGLAGKAKIMLSSVVPTEFHDCPPPTFQLVDWGEGAPP
jgi:hypothetical protein